MLSMEDIIDDAKSSIYTQNYSKKETIEGVKIVEIKNIVGEDGDFCEILRIGDNQLAQFPDFKVVQMNRSSLNPGVVKAWHLHLKQDEVWYIMPSDTLFVGLWDVRNKSKTSNLSMRAMLGGDKRLLFIPKGVAHGSANFSGKKINVFYFINQFFNIKDPDEKRLSWDSLGKDFWLPTRD